MNDLRDRMLSAKVGERINLCYAQAGDAWVVRLCDHSWEFHIKAEESSNPWIGLKWVRALRKRLTEFGWKECNHRKFVKTAMGEKSACGLLRLALSLEWYKSKKEVRIKLDNEGDDVCISMDWSYPCGIFKPELNLDLGALVLTGSFVMRDELHLSGWLANYDVDSHVFDLSYMPREITRIAIMCQIRQAVKRKQTFLSVETSSISGVHRQRDLGTWHLTEDMPTGHRVIFACLQRQADAWRIFSPVDWSDHRSKPKPNKVILHVSDPYDPQAQASDLETAELGRVLQPKRTVCRQRGQLEQRIGPNKIAPLAFQGLSMDNTHTAQVTQRRLLAYKNFKLLYGQYQRQKWPK